MIGLSLEGGGAKGAYQVGVYKAFLELGIKIDGVTGTSIGSFNGAMIVSGKFDELEKFWRTEDFTKALGLTVDESLNENKIIDNIKIKVNPLLNIIKNNGIDTTELFTLINNIIDEEKLRNSKMDYGLATYRINDAKALYLFKEDIPQGKLVNYIVASCFLPIFKMTKLDNEDYFLDGGFFDSSPSNMLEEKNYDKIYVVELNAIGVKKKKLGKSEIIKLSPSRYLGSMLNTNPENINRNIEMGYYDTIKYFKNYDGYKYLFKNKKIWLYRMLTRRVNKKILNRVGVFFFTQNKKELILKSIEYVLNQEKSTYGKIYDPIKEIKRIKKIQNEFIVYQFIRELRIF